MAILSRRDGLKLALCGGLASWHGGVLAQPGMEPPNSGPPLPLDAEFLKETEEGIAARAHVHDGLGSINLKPYRFGGAARPAHFIVYDLPPGSSEGVHTHLADNSNGLGSFDEFYYIIVGHGRMQIGESVVSVQPGDHVFTPIGTPHGIENASATDHLKVFLTFIQR